MSKIEKYETRGQRIIELEKEYAELPSLTRNGFAEFLARQKVPISAEALKAVVAYSIPGKQKEILQEVRGFVEEDQTYPIPAMRLGRALKDMEAVGEPKAKNRIQIMAFFNTGLARRIIRAPRAGERDYRTTTEECSRHLAGASATNLESNNASKGLEKPVLILEKLKLADSRRIKKKGGKDGTQLEKRDATYLRDFGGIVFNSWPLWPDEASSAPAP